MSRVYRTRAVVSLGLLVVLAVFTALGCGTTTGVRSVRGPADRVVLGLSEDISVIVRSDEYIMPVAELRTTKTYPEVVEIENKYIRVSLVPHRGRILFDFLFKPTGRNEFHRNARPTPIFRDNDYVVEFGGYYLSLPWNPRDRQPYDLEYQVLQEGPNMVEVYMWGEDPDSQAFGEVWVTAQRDSSLVQVKTRISNRTEEAIDIGFNDFAVIAVGGRPADCTLVVPVSKVTIGKSADSWMGVEGERVSWPQSWSRWGGFEHLGSFYVSADDLSGRFSAVINHDTGDTFLRLWEPAGLFDGIHIWSWGKDYKEMGGGEPSVNYENYRQSLSIPANGSIDFVSYFYALKGMRDVAAADSLFAGWIGTDRQHYEAKGDSRFTAVSQLGCSRDWENVGLVVSLTDLEGNVLRELISEPIAALFPSQVCTRSWKIDIRKLGIESGWYVLKLEVLDSGGSRLFAVSSMPVSIEL